MKQSTFIYDLETGQIRGFLAVWPEQDRPEIPDGCGLCLCGLVIDHEAAQGEIGGRFYVDPATGEFRMIEG